MKVNRNDIYRFRALRDFTTGGGMLQLGASLPTGAQKWLVGQIPEDATLSDVLRAIIIDAWLDDTDQSGPEDRQKEGLRQ